MVMLDHLFGKMGLRARKVGSLGGLLVGGTWDNGALSGRWASNWNNHPGDTWTNFGLRCGVPLQSQS